MTSPKLNTSKHVTFQQKAPSAPQRRCGMTAHLPCSLILVPSPPLTFLERPNERDQPISSTYCIQQAGEGKQVRRLVPGMCIFEAESNMLPAFLLNYYCSPLSDSRRTCVTMNDLTQEQSPENTQSSSSRGYRNTNKQQWEERKDLLFLRSFTKQ